MKYTLTLSHYTAEPFTLDRGFIYDQAAGHPGKPDGLWLSVDGEDDWPAWCRANDFNVEGLAHRTPFRLKRDANVLCIDHLEALVAFDGIHSRPMFPGARVARAINWAAVAERNDGIVIAPYLWTMRLDLLWYYGWDCASGCIWNLQAIEEAGDA